MPMIIISTKPGVIVDEKALSVICDEVVTYALNTNEGPLQPGNTTIIVNKDNRENGIDAVIQVKCCFFQDRYESCQERADLIRELVVKAYAFTRTGGCIPCLSQIRVAIWVEFLPAAYSGPEDDQKDKVEMTESAMFERIRSRCGFTSK